MRIDRLEIVNFKKFEQYTLDLHPQFTLLVGDNGSGKTSLLDALAIAAGIWLVNPPDSTLSNSGRNILPQEIRLEANKSGDRTQFVECKPVQIRAMGSIGDRNDVSWMRQIGASGSRTSNAEAKAVLQIIAQLCESEHSETPISLPVIAYYGAGRAWLPSNSRERRTTKSKSRRWDAFYDCFDERIRLPDLQNWFKNEAIAAVSRHGRMRPGYEVVKLAVLRCIPEADDFWYDPDLNEIVLEIAHNPQPFSNLSAGQKSIVALIADIAIKAVTLNAFLLPEELELDGETLPLLLQETSGLVLIDELDVHLHPKWQRRIVDTLKTTFPSIQFVCTSHSPFIIQSLGPGELIGLDSEDRQSLEYENRSIEDIAETIQFVEVPQQSLKARELAEATERYFELLQQADSTPSEQLAEAEVAYRQAAERFSNTPGLTALLKLEAMAKAQENGE
ncbi:AAA family ATPase [Synechococcus sp. PCC 7336]|uniref:AAA family ATPase n=1 Tax=Synechococcus sp. PCC 7336 TaxID=195250 RepID=UPI00034CF4D8|nr:AAA family ATPase [Synechococcus sp. PCC 7336]